MYEYNKLHQQIFSKLVPELKRSGSESYQIAHLSFLSFLSLNLGYDFDYVSKTTISNYSHCLDLDLNGKRPGITSDGKFSSYLIGRS